MIGMHKMKLTIDVKVFRMYCEMDSQAEIRQYARKLAEIYHGFRDAMCSFLQGEIYTTYYKKYD